MKHHRPSGTRRLRRSVAALAVTVTGSAGALGLLPAAAHAAVTVSPSTHHFTALDNAADPTFNQLLGINNLGDIVGFFTDSGGATSSWLLHAGHTHGMLVTP